MTDYKEYMKTLEEQIQNKRARALVAEEINGHIEEQAQGYEEEGMSREDAKREAVRQMGDPVETGCALNRIHRPAFPWKLFVLAVLLTAASILMSVVISGKTEGGASQAEQLRSLLVINGVSFAMIFVIMYFDYTWLFLHIRAVAVCYLPVSGMVRWCYCKLSDRTFSVLQYAGITAGYFCRSHLPVSWE